MFMLALLAVTIFPFVDAGSLTKKIVDTDSEILQNSPHIIKSAPNGQQLRAVLKLARKELQDRESITGRELAVIRSQNDGHDKSMKEQMEQLQHNFQMQNMRTNDKTHDIMRRLDEMHEKHQEGQQHLTTIKEMLEPLSQELMEAREADKKREIQLAIRKHRSELRLAKLFAFFAGLVFPPVIPIVLPFMLLAR